MRRRLQAACHILQLAANQQQLVDACTAAITASSCGRQLLAHAAAAAGAAARLSNSSQAGVCCGVPGAGGGTTRCFSAYAGAGSSSTGLRRINPNGAKARAASSADAAALAGGAASSSSSSESLLEMSQEVPGGSRPLLSWERWYWGVGVGGVALFLYSKLKTPDKTPEELAEAQRAAEELRQRRKDHIRSVLMAQNFLQGDSDPLEGLTPAQIVLFMEKYNIDPSDPLEGLTPEEIDAYMQQQEAAQRAAEQGAPEEAQGGQP